MASVLTDQYLAGSKISPLAPVPITTAAFLQLVPKFGTTTSNGVASLGLPIPDGAIDAYSSTTVVSPYRRYKAIVEGNVKTGTTTNVTINLVLTDAAGTVTILGTTGAKAVNTTTSAFKLEVEFTFDPSAVSLAGQQSGYVGQTIIAVAALSATTQPVITNPGANLSVSALVSAADATSVLTIDEISLELL